MDKKMSLLRFIPACDTILCWGNAVTGCCKMWSKHPCPWGKNCLVFVRTKLKSCVALGLYWLTRKFHFYRSVFAFLSSVKKVLFWLTRSKCYTRYPLFTPMCEQICGMWFLTCPAWLSVRILSLDFAEENICSDHPHLTRIHRQFAPQRLSGKFWPSFRKHTAKLAPTNKMHPFYAEILVKKGARYA